MHTSSLLVVGLFAATLCGQGTEPAQVGDQVPEFSFGDMINGDGRTKLSEFRGQPILIDFWGTR